MSVNPHSLRLDGAFWTMWTRLYVVSQTYGYRGLTLELWIMGFYRNDRSQAMHSVLSQSCFSPIGWGEGWICTALSLSLSLSHAAVAVKPIILNLLPPKMRSHGKNEK